MTSAGSKILMLGLKGSGKTTFLAAIWHYLESSELSDRLEIPHLQPDRDYLNSIRTSWLAAKPVGRTSLRMSSMVSLSLKDKTNGADINLSMPDLSGESFRLQWSNRKAPKTYVDFAQGCTGAFLFIHPSDVKKTHTIPAGSDETWKVSAPVNSRLPRSLNWTPEQSSTQVQLVDLVQLLMRLREQEGSMKLAVVISAWDRVKARISPSGWLGSRLPLLAQFLQGHKDDLVSEIFGISAQGGDLLEDRSRLLDTEVPSKRCFALQGNSIESVALSAPLQFLLDNE